MTRDRICPVCQKRPVGTTVVYGRSICDECFDLGVKAMGGMSDLISDHLEILGGPDTAGGKGDGPA